MAVEFNIEEAAEWDDDFAQKVITYCEQRARFGDLARIAELRSEQGPSELEAGTDEWFASANAGEVADWVGDDKDKAAYALQKESERDEPRARLSSKLEKVINT